MGHQSAANCIDLCGPGLVIKERAGKERGPRTRARLAAIMNIRVFGSVWHSPLLKWAMAAILGCAVASAFAAPNPVSGPKGAGDGGFQTAAPHAILIEAESGSVLFEKAADDLIPPASLSKLMTAEVVFNEVKQG